MPTPTFTKTGTKATTAAKLDTKVFGEIPTNHELLKLAYTAYLANGRKNLAVTKKRGEVRGGGKKPWKQKGTGRARFGSTRNPIWRGGGIAFGPTGNENYSLHLNVKAKRLALRQALSLADKDNKIIVIEDFILKEPKTVEAVNFLKKIEAHKQTLLVVTQKTDDLNRATANLNRVKLVQSTYLTVFDTLNADHVVITEEALKQISDWLSPAEKAKPLKVEEKK